MKHTTILFLRRTNTILLAMKKRGFGVDKWNGAGGKVEPNETYEQAAIRECEEELGVTPYNLKKLGELHFFDLPDTEHYCHVYVTVDWKGNPHETEEMRPQWFHTSDIPFDQMWPDDKFWMPLLLAGKYFKGVAVIENNTVKENTIHEVVSL
ncbi:MAG TPA: 8-oxo-dGTP diphosphatase [Verrucomicrobiae bacterium]|nr:8-oxo-dGTP diphosphatase [Verrucomicrobiae bacterium]